jgi:two-component system, OmpR family, response regulator
MVATGTAGISHVLRTHGPRSRPLLRPSAPTAVVADPDEGATEQLRLSLLEHNVQVTLCTNGADALLQVGLLKADLLLVAATLPVVSGATVVETLRRSGQEIPAIVGVGEDDNAEAARALVAGATACVRKPYRIRELLPILQAAGQELPAPRLRCGRLELDEAAHEVQFDQRPLILPLREYEVLRYLLRHQHRVVSQQELLDEIWGADHHGDRSTVTVHIKRLRGRLIAAGGSADLIQTLRGVGYRLRPSNPDVSTL